MAYEYDRLEREEGSGSFLMGLLAGTVLGAGLGMLFAPRPGSELRHQLTEQAGRLRSTANETYNQATEKVNKASEKVSKMVDRGREAYDRARTSMGDGGTMDTTGSLGTSNLGTTGNTGSTGYTPTGAGAGSNRT
jgi:gas vesicle protein